MPWHDMVLSSWENEKGIICTIWYGSQPFAVTLKLGKHCKAVGIMKTDSVPLSSSSSSFSLAFQANLMKTV